MQEKNSPVYKELARIFGEDKARPHHVSIEEIEDKKPNIKIHLLGNMPEHSDSVVSTTKEKRKAVFLKLLETELGNMLFGKNEDASRLVDHKSGTFDEYAVHYAVPNDDEIQTPMAQRLASIRDPNFASELIQRTRLMYLDLLAKQTQQKALFRQSLGVEPDSREGSWSSEGFRRHAPYSQPIASREPRPDPAAPKQKMPIEHLNAWNKTIKWEEFMYSDSVAYYRTTRKIENGQPAILGAFKLIIGGDGAIDEKDVFSHDGRIYINKQLFDNKAKNPDILLNLFSDTYKGVRSISP